MANIVINESLDSQVKQAILAKLLEDGYGTYAKWLGRIDLYVADRYGNEYIPTAAMFTDKKLIIINPSFADIAKMKAAGDDRDDQEKLLDQLSVIVRHELLHFLLVHQIRLSEHIKKSHPDLYDKYSRRSIHEVENYAADYEVSDEGYDDHDKEVVRLMTLNNRVIGGLIREDDHPDWGKLTVEQLFDKLVAEAETRNQLSAKKPKVKVNVKKAATTSPEYNDAYNEIIKRINNNYSDGDVATMIADALAGKDIIDPTTGEVILSAGD